MPQSNQTAEFNTFVGGLVTEASPLTFPENASLDEANFELKRDGTRSRRLGMDYEDGLTPYMLSYDITPIDDPTVSTFTWENVSGIASKSFVVAQVHDKIYIIDRTDDTLKAQAWVKASFNLCTTCQINSPASFASVNGFLVVAFGEPEIIVLQYNESTDDFTREDYRIKTRDLFGVEDLFNNGGTTIDLLSPEYINFRPVAEGVDMDEHVYNLRNQGWAVPRADWDTSTNPLKQDPISEFEGSSPNYRALPSNADYPTLWLYPNTALSDKTSERFDEEAAFKYEPSRSRAPVGHFVIDLLERGQSRIAEIARLSEIYADANPTEVDPSVAFRTSAVVLPDDATQGGAKAVAEFAGRVFYAGFSSTNLNGDSQSPNLASYVFFSQLIKDKSQVARCYQEGDPTSATEPDLLETDGGFIRIAGAYNIQRLVDVGSVLMVFAENGVWSIGGSDSGQFSATNQSVSKVSEHGVVGSQSVVVADGNVMYWGDDAIYVISPNQFGDYTASELSVNIKTFYQSISSDSKSRAQGIYDSYDRKVRWVYENYYLDQEDTRELVFDLVLSAFYPMKIARTRVDSDPIPVAPIKIPPFAILAQDIDVAVGDDLVFSDADQVVANIESTSGGFRETSYLVLLNSDNPNSTTMTFATYSNDSFLDWGTEDSEAYLITGYIGNGDFHRFKQIPYIYFHFLRTEDGFTDSGDDLVPTNQSSCLVQAQWDWANTAAYGKWGRQFQAYKYRRNYIAADVTDNYDYGTRTIVSRNKLRGRGRVVSLYIKTEPAKDLKLLGWSMTMGMNNNG